jgi:hypothetical protein
LTNFSKTTPKTKSHKVFYHIYHNAKSRKTKKDQG